MNPAASSTIETLTAIWQRVLQTPQVGIEDNFFDLGGDSSLSLELFNHIARACGRDLPPVMIYHAPTIAALARVLDERTTPKIPALVQLKSGTAQPPVFLTHGLGGSVMDFYQVVKHTDTPQPVYGMQARGIDGAEEPFERIEDLATYFLEAVRRLQPKGPYFLIGFSLGGLVTLEMAQQLVARGDRVALLAMLDSYPHVRYLSAGQRMRLTLRQTAQRFLGHLGGPNSSTSTDDNSLSPLQARLRESAYAALEHYQPHFYPGKVNFVRAAVPTDFPANASAVWRPFVAQLEITTVPGDHLGIMTIHFDSLAARINELVRRAKL